MSRSFKKFPCVTDHGKSTYLYKRMANKKVRHTQDLPNGKAYKKVFDSWDICDYKYCNYSYASVAEDVLDGYERGWYDEDEIMSKYYRVISK